MDTDSETLLESENPACQAVNGRIVIARGATERGCVPRGAGSAAARRALKPVEYFRRGHSCEAAAAGLRHSRGPGAGPATAGGGKRSATPLSCGQRSSKARGSRVRAKAPSPLRFAGAVQDANGIVGRVGIARGATERGCVPRGAGSAAARRNLKPC